MYAIWYANWLERHLTTTNAIYFSVWRSHLFILMRPSGCRVVASRYAKAYIFLFPFTDCVLFSFFFHFSLLQRDIFGDNPSILPWTDKVLVSSCQLFAFSFCYIFFRQTVSIIIIINEINIWSTSDGHHLIVMIVSHHVWIFFFQMFSSGFLWILGALLTWGGVNN